MAEVAKRRLSANEVWDATTAFMKRHGGLVFTLALAFSALPQILAYPFFGDTMSMQPGTQPAPEQLLRILPAMLIFIVIGLIGSLAIYSLVLRPGLSVGEAIGQGVRRLPASLGQLILLALLGSLVALPIGLIIGLGAAGGTAPSPALAIVPLLLVPVFVYLLLRLFLGQVAVADGAGPVDGLRRSWELTRGNALRVFGMLLIVGIVFLIVFLALSFVLGGLAQLLGGAIGGENTGAFLAVVVSAIVSALLSAVISVLYAQIYRNLTGPDYAETFA